MASKGGKKGKKKGPSESQAPKPAAQKLTHSLDMINACSALKVRPSAAARLGRALTLVLLLLVLHGNEE